MGTDWKKYLEFFILGFCALTLILLYGHVTFSDRLVVVAFATLSLYYLLSGALVLFNKQVHQIIRIIYFIGLWSISIGLIGVIYKIKFWLNSDLLLMLGFSFNLAVLVFMFTYYRSSREHLQPLIQEQFGPVLKRLVIYPLVFFFFYWISDHSLYRIIGEHRYDETFTRIFLDALHHPEDKEKQEELRLIRIEKGKINDDQGSPENSRPLD